VLVAALLLDYVELNILLSFARTIFTITLLESHGELIESTVSFIDKDAGTNFAQHDLEELVVEADKYCPEDVKGINNLQTTLTKAPQVEGTIAFEVEVVEHPPGLE
jgi:hypothetical protein